jgi:hypothetical protein
VRRDRTANDVRVQYVRRDRTANDVRVQYVRRDRTANDVMVQYVRAAGVGLRAGECGARAWKWEAAVPSLIRSGVPPNRQSSGRNAVTGHQELGLRAVVSCTLESLMARTAKAGAAVDHPPPADSVWDQGFSFAAGIIKDFERMVRSG